MRADKGAPGIDGMGIYQHQPVRRISIPKPQGGERLLGIPTFIDRIIQQAIAQVRTPIFEAVFSESSFGFRPGRAAHGALRQVQGHIKAGSRIAVDLDLAKFFDNVKHDVLMACVARKVRDKQLLALIGRYLRAGVLVGETLQATELGTPQGAPWLRRRLRMRCWKQWRWVRTKVRHLLALDTGKRQAIMTALNSKSYWHLSKTLIRFLWMKTHGYV